MNKLSYEEKLMYEAIENNIKSFNGELNKHQLNRKMLDCHYKFNSVCLAVDVLVKLNKIIVKNWKLFWIDYPEIYNNLNKDKKRLLK